MSLIDLRLTCFHSIKKHEQPLLLSAHLVISMQTYLPSSFGLNKLCVSLCATFRIALAFASVDFRSSEKQAHHLPICS